MTNQDLIQLIAEALEVDASALTPETRIDSIDEWSSVGWLSVTALLDERYGIHPGAKAIRAFQTVADVTDYVLQQAE